MDINISSVHNLDGLHAAAAFTVNSKSIFNTKDVKPKKIGSVEYMPWGEDNDTPNRLIDLIESDETLSTCQMFNSEICYGAGLVYDTEGADNSVKDAVNDFCIDNSLPNYFMGVTQDLKYFAFSVSAIILNAEGTKIVKLVRKEACYCRFAPVDSYGKIPYIYYADWSKTPKPSQIEKIELLDFAAPLPDLMTRLGKRANAQGLKVRSTKSQKFAIVTRIPSADNSYYPVPYYASLFRGNWYNIKQLVGIAKEAKLKNSAPIKYHIEISDRYFSDIFKDRKITDPKEQQKCADDEKQQILDFLTAAENSGKVWFSKFFVNVHGDVQHDVVINKIENSKEGGDWATDIQEAINMICFTMRVHSNLVGSVPGKSQTNNSGSDKRELYTIAQALQKPYHDLLFVVHQLIIRFNDWKGVYPDCPFIQLTTLDEKKDAKTVTINKVQDEDN